MKISIIILTYNRLQSLKKCIDSILITNNNNVEIIVINNASTDGTTEWLDSIKYNVKHIKMDSNIGVIARNEGIYQAKGDIIFQVDDDCTVDPGFYNIITSNMQDDKIGAIGQDASNFNGWLSFDRNVRQGEYCDFVTGYLWAFRHKPFFYYDMTFGKFWREETDFQLNIKFEGYKILKCQSLGNHSSQRKELDYEQLKLNTEYLVHKWKKFIDCEYYINDNQVFEKISISEYIDKHLGNNRIIIG